jgi:hypothetical protein
MLKFWFIRSAVKDLDPEAIPSLLVLLPWLLR